MSSDKRAASRRSSFRSQGKLTFESLESRKMLDAMSLTEHEPNNTVTTAELLPNAVCYQLTGSTPQNGPGRSKSAAPQNWFTAIA